MYAKKEGDRWWLYFDTVEEAEEMYKKEEHNLWEDNYDRNQHHHIGAGWGRQARAYDFSCSISNYRRQLTDEFTVRESFEAGDKVCWCGRNGKVVNVLSEGVVVNSCCETFSRTFTLDGRYLIRHKYPSLFHGHNVLRPEDQRFPVVKKKEPEKPTVDIEASLRKAICSLMSTVSDILICLENNRR